MQKLTKRLKKARQEEEGASTTKRLEDELEATKSIECNGLAPYYLRHTIFKSHKQLADILAIGEDLEAPHREERDSFKNVVGRLFGSNTFRTALGECISALELTAGIINTSVKKPQKAERTSSRQEAMHKDQKPRSVESSNDEDHSKFTTFEAEAEGDESSPSELYVESESDDRPAYASFPDPAQSASTFLPSLQSGYLPALDGSDDEGELKGLFPAQKKERKNRRGQRARRKILEAKHGNKANHVIKEREAAQKEYEERVARRATKEAERTGANAIAVEEAEKNRKERREAKLRPIHGSWQLAKQQKEKMRMAKPEGSKIVFD